MPYPDGDVDYATREEWVAARRWTQGNAWPNAGFYYIYNEHTPGCIGPEVCDFYWDGISGVHKQESRIAYENAGLNMLLALAAPKLWLALQRAADIFREADGIGIGYEEGFLASIAAECQKVLDEAVPLHEGNYGD